MSSRAGPQCGFKLFLCSCIRTGTGQFRKVDNSILLLQDLELFAQIISLLLLGTLKAKHEANEEYKILHAGLDILLGLAVTQGQGENVGHSASNLKQLLQDAAAVRDDAGDALQTSDEASELGGKPMRREVKRQSFVGVLSRSGAQEAVR